MAAHSGRAPAEPSSTSRSGTSREATAGSVPGHPSPSLTRLTQEKPLQQKREEGKGGAAELPVANFHQRATSKLKPRGSRSFSSLPGRLEVFPVTTGS